MNAPAHRSRFSVISAVFLIVILALAAWAGGCGSNTDNSNFGNGDGGGDGNTDGNGFTNGGDGGTLVITPANPTVDVTINNGVVTATPVTFVAKTAGGAVVTATWGVDRGDLGKITGAGIFSASGLGSGVGNITANAGGETGSTGVTVSIHSIQVGNPYGPPDAGAGGVGGVGGEGLGGPVDAATQTALTSTSNPPATPAALGFIYPYNKTVFPRGMLGPLLQWQSTQAGIDAVSVHLSEKNYDFQGFYSVTGPSQFHQPIDPAAWTTATNGNTGDLLHVEVKVHAGTTVTGPISEDWTIGAGILSGTIYYQSYSSNVAGSAGTLEIRPGKTDPELVLKGTEGQCIVCHEVSDDGSTMFAQDMDYSDGKSYDLRDGGAVIQSYVGGGSATSSDGTMDNQKFVWSGLWKDGTFGMLNQDNGNLYTEQNTGGMNLAPENLYRRDNGNAAATTGLENVTQAVTPAFSHDGTKVAFNAWTLGAGAPIASGNGHTLDIMDFACGAAVSGGAPGCTTFAFSNLRRLYTNADTTNGFVGWPAWMPDNNGIAFHNVVRVPSGAVLQTRYQAEAQLWYTNVPASGAGDAILMNALNGLDSTGASYLPGVADVTGSNAAHSDDTKYNYEPTVNPVASAGYFWVVFTSRRMYGNIAAGDPYDYSGGHPLTKKLWVAAIDINPKPGVDPSHPAFYLPGQELNAPNMRGFWVVDPCRANGAACDTGAECCGGFCRSGGDGGALVCQNPSGCANENEKCATTADCCGAGGLTCINGFCVAPPPR